MALVPTLIAAAAFPLGFTVGLFVARHGERTLDHPSYGLQASFLDDYEDDLFLIRDARPAPGYDTPEARARRVQQLTAERDALEASVEAGHARREARDAQRRHWLDLERLRYRLGRRSPHIDDMVA